MVKQVIKSVNEYLADFLDKILFMFQLSTQNVAIHRYKTPPIVGIKCRQSSVQGLKMYDYCDNFVLRIHKYGKL